MRACAASVLLFLAAALSTGAPASAQEAEKLRITIPAPGTVFLPLFIAVDTGLFKKRNLDVEIVMTSGDGPDIDSLIAGSVQFSISTPNRLMTTYEQGRPLLGIMSVSDTMASDCIIGKATAERIGFRPDMPSAEKYKLLKGLTVAGSRPGSFTYLVLVDYARRAGLTPQQDVKIIGAGAPAAMTAAIENGQVDVGCSGSPITEMAVSRGKIEYFAHNSLKEDKDYDDFLFQLLYVRPDYAQSHAAITRAVVASLVEAIGVIKKSSDDALFPEVESRFKGLPQEVNRAALAGLRPSLSDTGKITQISVDKAAKFLRDAGALKAEIPWTAITTNDYLSP